MLAIMVWWSDESRNVFGRRFCSGSGMRVERKNLGKMFLPHYADEHVTLSIRDQKKQTIIVDAKVA